MREWARVGVHTNLVPRSHSVWCLAMGDLDPRLSNSISICITLSLGTFFGSTQG